MNTTDKNNARTLADYHPAFKNFSWARTFNETPINARKCIQILTKIIYMINQGEQLGQTEATEIFFAMTKLFQSKDMMLRRMIYLSIKEMSTVANDVIIVTSSLTRDMTGKEDSHRGPAMQKLYASMMQSVERYMKQTIVDKLPSVALTSSVHLMRQSPEVVKRWVNEVQEAVNNDNIMVQYHELALLYQIRRTDKHTIRKLIVKFSKTALRSPYTFIRIAANLINEEGEGTDSPMYDFIDSCLRHKNEMIIYEAASTIVSLKCVTPKELSSALNVLQLFISSPKPVLRYAAVRTLNKRYDQHIDNRLKYTDGFKGIIFKALFDRLMPDFCLVDNYNSHVKSLSSGLDLEFLPLHIVSVLELKTKLKDSDVGQLLHYLRIILDYSPSSRSFILGAITDFRDIRFAMVRRSTDDDDQFKYEASLKDLQNRNGYLSHHLTMFFTADRSKFGFCRLEPLPDNIRIDNRLLGIGANAMVFSCSLINGQSNEYALKISNDSVQKEVSIYQQLYADKYRIVQVHSNAFLFLHPPGRVVSKENILNNAHLIWNQIKKAHNLSNTLREEGGYGYKTAIVNTIISIISIVEENPEAKEADCEHTSLATSILYLLGREGPRATTPAKYIRYSYNRVILENAPVRAVVAAVSALAKFDDEVRDRATLYYQLLKHNDKALNSAYILNSMNVSLSSLERLLHRYTIEPTTKPFDVRSVPVEAVPVELPKDISIGVGLPRPGIESKTNREDIYDEQLSAIPEFAHLGPIYKSSLPVDLTEKRVTVQMDGLAEGFEVVHYTPCQVIKCNDTGTTYTLVKLPDDSSPVTGTMKYTVKNCDSTTDVPDDKEGYADEFVLEDIEITVSDHVQKVLKPNWSASWEEIEAENELKDTYTLSIRTLEECVKKIINYMGMQACERSDKIPEGKASHALYLAGVYRGGHDVLVRAKMALGGTTVDPGAQAITMQLTIRSTDESAVEVYCFSSRINK
ncbi:unnamed protein product [Rotaria socialis]|uniref:Coatomer subunit gamma n=3 Tax=Rotaria socialis TaxID=392032 RepID=A0A820UAI7_9BILA|nr:unnamed protein product [Rotaria socialis]